MTTRPAAVADLFYPGDAHALASTIGGMLEAADSPPALRPKALIVPHAGYVYSGPVAASAYRLLEPLRGQIERVVLLGPAHRVYVRGMAVPTVDEFSDPLGPVPLDREALERISGMPGVLASDQAHAQEHSLEVQLPFLQTVLGAFALVPLLVGDCPADQVAAVIDVLWDGPGTLIVVSSDLSHYHAYRDAQRIDAATSAAIVAKRSDLHGEMACGAAPINGLMRSQGARGLEVYPLDVRNSGDTAGDRSRVVGYGAYVLA